ncbi:PREDICTED: UPF0722 protein C11orf88 homolog [Haliaeetus leucocephalus]|uniref:UPF0722 protein C11orf88 homolog n=1 Tax=Haliaeetus leucocephalus TaxID=52644 RepID=UPI00053CE110|nr:PREDICTED: UPF0722 protein C11orf88 homolog [Haliaeetus leucocephalus]
MERGHGDAATCGATGTETEQHLMAPNGPLVFAGSSPANVGFACTFWTSAVLPPPLESCLGPATLEREGTLPGEETLPSEETLPESEKNSEKETLLKAQSMEKTKVKEKYLQQARRREEVLALQRKQREERIAKELMSHSHKPKIKTDQVR